MPLLSERLQILRRLDTNAATKALADALEHAQPEELVSLARAILTRPTSQGCLTLVRHYHRFAPDIRGQIRKVCEKLSTVLISAVRASARATQRNGLNIIGENADARCAVVLKETLALPTNELTPLAADALLRIVRAVRGGASSSASGNAPSGDLDCALTSAVDSYPIHRQYKVLLAAALFSELPGPALTRWLNDSQHPSHWPMRGVLKYVDAETAEGSLLAWLGIDLLAPQVVDRLPRMIRQGGLPGVLQQAHLLLLPKQRHRLARLDPRRPCTVDARVALALDDASQARLPVWVAAVAMPMTKRIQRLADGLSFRQPTARLAALRQLILIEHPLAAECWSSFCYDPDERIARIATHQCIRRRSVGLAQLLRRLLNSPHVSVRQIAAAHSQAADFDALWRGWRGSGGRSIDPANYQDARRLLHESRQVFATELRRRLAGGDVEARLSGIRIAAATRMLEEVELELLALTRHARQRLVASAITVLGRLDSPASRQALNAALAHPDARVRANAVEAIAMQRAAHDDDRTRQALQEIAQCPDNRPRANAIRALATIDRGWAADKLGRMLRDRRPLHRVSALWVADRTTMTECAADVAEIAQNDGSPPMRKRARRTAKRLLARMTARQHHPIGVEVNYSLQTPDPAATPHAMVTTGIASPSAPARDVPGVGQGPDQ